MAEDNDKQQDKNQGDAKVEFTFSDIPVMGVDKQRKADFSFASFDKTTNLLGQPLPQSPAPGDHDQFSSLTQMLSESPVPEREPEQQEEGPLSDDTRELEADDGGRPEEIETGTEDNPIELKDYHAKPPRKPLIDVQRHRQDLKRDWKKLLTFAVVGTLVAGAGYYVLLSWFPESTGVYGAASKSPKNRKLEELFKTLAAGDELVKAKKYDAAIEKFQKAMEEATNQKKDNIVLFKIANAHNAKGEADKAIEFYDKAIATGFPDSQPEINAAKLLLAAGKLDESAARLAKALAKFKSDPALTRLLAECQSRKGDLTGYAATMSKLQPTTLTEPELKQLAETLASLGKKDAAFKLNSLGATKFNKPEFYLPAADNAPNQAARLDILTQASQKLIGDKDKNHVKFLLCLCLEKAGKKKEMMDLFGEVREKELPPERFGEYLQVFVEKLKADESDTAAKETNATEDGKAAAKLDAEAKLQEKFLNLMSLTPAIADQVKLQDTLLKYDYIPLAIKISDQMLREKPDSPQRNFLFARALGSSPDAKVYFAKAVKLKPDFYEAALALGKINLGARDWKQAALMFSKCAALRPDDLDVRHSLATAKVNSGGGPQSIADYQQFLDSQKVPPATAAETVFPLCLRLPTPDLADACLKTIAALPDFPKDKLREMRLRRKAAFDKLEPGDFTTWDSGAVRNLQIVQLLSNGKARDALLLQTPPDEFPDFWKTFLLWRHKHKKEEANWKKNAELIYKKYKDKPDPTYSVIAALWLGKIDVERAKQLLPRIPVEQEPLLMLMIAEKFKMDNQRIKAKIAYLRASEYPNSVYRSLTEYYKNKK